MKCSFIHLIDLRNQTTPTSIMRTKIWFPNFPLILRLKPPRSVKNVKMPPPGTEGTFRTDEIILDTVPQLTKPQMKNFLMAVYGLDVKYINSLVRMGRRRNEQTEMPRQEKDFKRFYVKLHDEVELPNIPKALSAVKGSVDANPK